MNKQIFYNQVRNTVFKGKLTTSQVSGMESILDYNHNLDDKQLAYVLATVAWETAWTCQPIKEIGGADYFFKMYDPKGSRPTVAKRLGNTVSGDGVKYHGRGFCQLTGRANYQRFSTLLGIDLVNKPDLALDLNTATRILFLGMTDGLYTGKKLADYLGPDKEDWVGARRIVNGVDHNNDIAVIALKFYDAIQSSG